MATWPPRVTLAHLQQLPGLQELGLDDVRRLPGFPSPTTNQFLGVTVWDRRHVRAW